jgi:hypothetical protein
MITKELHGIFDYKYTDEEIEEVIGNYNSFPPNMEEIGEKEFAQSMFFVYDGVREFRQPIKEFNKLFIGSLRIWWFFDKTYIALYNDFWYGKVHYYRGWICKHDYEGVTIGRCLTKYTCKKCGFVHEVDSSD